jgi:hypothetical protein
MTDRTDMQRLQTMTDAQIARAVAEDSDTFIPDAGWIEHTRLVIPDHQP